MIDIIAERIKALSTMQKAVYLAFISVFLHYIITAVVIIGLGVYILADKSSRRYVWKRKSHPLLCVFCLFTAGVAFAYKNYIGVVCSAVFYLLILILYWVKSFISAHTFDGALDICCAVAIPLSFAVIIEKLINLDVAGYRCKLWFFNANYMTAIFAAVVIFCAWKVMMKAGNLVFYYIAAGLCFIAMYLSGSMFAFVEIFVGICMLLILRRKHFLLACFFFAVFIVLVVLYFVPEIFPRIMSANVQTDKRIEVWNTAMELLKAHPILGQGFLTYYHNALQNPDMYQTTHAHNFALEPILSFGIIGTLLLIALIWAYFKRVIDCKEQLKNNKVTLLVLALSAAVIVHATTDLTLMWIQTGLLYVLVFAGIGIDERKLGKGEHPPVTDDYNDSHFWEE